MVLVVVALMHAVRVGVVLMAIALVRIVSVGVVLMIVALVHAMHVPRLIAVVLMVVALVHLMHMRVMLVIVAFVVVVRHSSTSSMSLQRQPDSQSVNTPLQEYQFPRHSDGWQVFLNTRH